MVRPEESPALAPPPGNPRFPMMDAVRGAAALAVVAVHSYRRVYGPGWDWVDELRVAVPVFFALSGFLLFRPYVAALAANRRPPRVRDFLRRRALRVVPGYWFALTVLALVLGAPLVAAFTSHWWLFYGFGQTYSLRYFGSGLQVAWTVSVEVSFYLFLPLFAWATRRLSRRVGWRMSTSLGVGLLFTLGIVIRLLNTTVRDPGLLGFIQHITYSLPGQLPNFAVGMGLAVVSVDRERRGAVSAAVEWVIDHPWVAWAVAAGCFAFGATLGAYHAPVAVPGLGMLTFETRFVVNGVLEAVLAAACLIPAAFEPSTRRVSQRILSWRALGFVGLVSYGLYLWHLPLAGWLNRHTLLGHLKHWPALPGWGATFVVILAVGLVAGTASYYLVELPFLKLKPGWRARRRGLRPAPATTRSARGARLR